MGGITRPGQTPHNRHRWLHPFLAFLCLTGILSMMAFLGETGLIPRKLGEVPTGGKPLLFEEWNDLCVAVFTGEESGSSNVTAIDRFTGTVSSQQPILQGTALWAGLRGNSVFVQVSQKGDLFLIEFSLPELEVVSTHSLPAQTDTPLFDCDSEGHYFFSPDDGQLWMGEFDEEAHAVNLPGLENLEFLEVTPQGTLFVSTSNLYFWGSASQPEALQNAPSFFPAFCLLGETTMLDLFGGLYQFGEADILPLDFVLPVPTDSLLCAQDRKGSFVYDNGGGTVACSSLDGESLGTVELSGILLALCGSGALTQEEGAYWFTPFQFFQETSTPSPTASPSPSPSPAASPTASPAPSPSPAASPTASPAPSPSPAASPTASPAPSPSPAASPTASPSPSPSPTVSPTASPAPSTLPGSFLVEGDLLVVPEGTSLNTVVEYFGPDAVEVTRPDGTLVTSGKIATGMTVQGYTLVVEGDCDGSGTISHSDLLRAQDLLMEDGSEDDPYRRAADLDRDGALTTLDLVLLSSLTEG